MITFSPRAERQVAELLRQYRRRGRPEAQTPPISTLDEAEQIITTVPNAGLAAPRPYPELAAQGEAWIKAGRYWVAFSLTNPPVILAIFYDAADIPGRL